MIYVISMHAACILYIICELSDMYVYTKYNNNYVFTQYIYIDNHIQVDTNVAPD